MRKGAARAGGSAGRAHECRPQGRCREKWSSTTEPGLPAATAHITDPGRKAGVGDFRAPHRLDRCVRGWRAYNAGVIRVLDRACLREGVINFAFYGVGYLGLIAVLVCVPLLKQGAPPLSVLAFLPDQLMFISMLALPLAMVTALLATIGRMREDGEITALMAAGISSFRIALSLLPIALVLALWLGIAAHLVLPSVARRLVEGRATLANQAAATNISRHRPIYQTPSGTDIVSAVGVHHDMLQDLFAVRIEKPSASGEGAMEVCFAPEARFVTDPHALTSDQVGALELHHAWFMRIEPPAPAPNGAAPGYSEVLTGLMPLWSLRLKNEHQNLSDLQDAFSTGELRHLIASTPVTEDNRAYVRGLERAWHTRWMIPCAVLVYWAFAVGMGLALGRNNRLLAIFLGLLTVVGTLIPGFGIVRSLGARLMFDAGWLLWPPVILLALSASWLLWRQR